MKVVSYVCLFTSLCVMPVQCMEDASTHSGRRKKYKKNRKSKKRADKMLSQPLVGTATSSTGNPTHSYGSTSYEQGFDSFSDGWSRPSSDNEMSSHSEGWSRRTSPARQSDNEKVENEYNSLTTVYKPQPTTITSPQHNQRRNLNSLTEQELQSYYQRSDVDDDNISDKSLESEHGSNSSYWEKGSDHTPEISITKMFRYYSNADQRLFGIGAFLCVFRAFMQIPYMLLIREVINAVGEEESEDAYDRLVNVAWGYGLFGVTMFFANAIGDYSFCLVAERAALRARFAYFNSLISQDTAWYDSLDHVASLPSTMETHLLQVQNAQSSHLTNIMLSVPSMFVMLGVAFYFSYLVTLIYLSIFPLAMYVISCYKEYTMKSAVLTSKAYAKAGSIAEEVLQNVITVVAFGGEEQAAERYSAALDDARIQRWKNMIVTEGTFGTICLALAMFGVCIWYGGTVLISDDEVNPRSDEPYIASDIMVSIVATAWVLTRFRDTIDSWKVFIDGRQAASAMFEIIDLKPVIEPKHRSEFRSPLPHQFRELLVIQFQDVHFSYPSRPELPVLQGLTLNIKAGQKVAIVGEGGSGKSTIIQLLERFYDPSNKNYFKNWSGKLTVNAIDLGDVPISGWRGAIGYVGQQPALFSASIMENIRLGEPAASDEDVILAAKLAHAHEFICSFTDGYETHVGKAGSALSGGQKQRIAIARALIKKPKILLLDEATSALDNTSQKMVQATIDELQANHPNLTMITVAHRLSTIRASDRIFFLSQGRVAEEGRHEQLMAKRGQYYSMVETQEAVFRLQNESVNKRRFLDDPDSIALSSSFETDSHDGTRSDRSLATRNSITFEDIENAVSNRDLDEDITMDYIKRRLTDAGASVNEGTIQQERQTVILGEFNYSFSWMRLLSFTKKENFVLPVVCLSALAASSYFPLYGFLTAQGAEMISACEDHRDTDGYIFPDDICLDRIDDIRNIAIYAAVNGFAALISFVTLGVSVGFIMGWAVLRIRTAAFAAVLKQEPSYHEHPDHTSGILSARLATSAIALSQLMGPLSVVILQIICSLSLGVFFAFGYAWQIALILMFGLPLFMAASWAMSKVWLSNDTRSSLYSGGGSFAAEAILNFRNVRSLNAQDSMDKAYRKLIEPSHRLVVKQLPKNSIVTAFLPASISTLNCIMYGLGAYLVKNDYITAHELYGSQLCIYTALIIVESRLYNLPDISAGKLAAFDLFSIIDRESRMDPTVEQLGAAKSIGDGLVTFNNVNFTFHHRPDVQVLHDVSFSVPIGSTIGLVGPSGSGKSTILRLMLRLYDPNSGSICVGGTDLRELDLSWWRKNLGFVQQEPVLFDMSIEDNIRYGNPDATHEQILDAAIRANIDFVGPGKLMNWSDVVGLHGGHLSGGQKQRIAIARAIIRDPKFLLLDEATSALDSQSQLQVQQALDEAAKGRTSFVIAHRLSTIANANKILVIADGQIIEQGTYEKLISQDTLFSKMALGR